MIKHIAVSALIFAFVIIPATAAAETVVRFGQDITISDDQVVEGDFYGAGDAVIVSGTTQGDVAAAAGSVTINGAVEGDVLLISGVSHLHASVTDDVRVLGGEVLIADSVGGDVFVVGGKLTVLPTAAIAGDVFFFGGESEINGAVTGSIQGTADAIRVNAQVGGDIDVTATDLLTLGDRASIEGDVRYTSNHEILRSASAVIEGSLTQGSVSVAAITGAPSQAFTFLSVTFIALIILLLARTSLTNLLRDTYTNFGMRGLLGLSFFFAAPAIILLFVFIAFGLSLTTAAVSSAGYSALLLPSGILFAGYVFALLLVTPISAIILGGLLAKIFTKKLEISLLSTLIGSALLSTISLVPVIGPILVLMVTMVVLGALVRALYLSLVAS